MTSYPGTRKRVSITITDETADPVVLADPTAMTVTYGPARDDEPTVNTFPGDAEIVHDGVGLFHIDIDCPTAGTWAVNVEATAGLVGDGQLAWTIAQSLIG